MIIIIFNRNLNPGKENSKKFTFALVTTVLYHVCGILKYQQI